LCKILRKMDNYSIISQLNICNLQEYNKEEIGVVLLVK
jgi:hypothetical protein